MTVLLPDIGVPSTRRAETLLEKHLSSIVGTFWVMNDADWWINTVLEENQAQAILDGYENGYFEGGHDNPLYLGFCIIVVGDKSNPANVSFVVQHVRMERFEGILLRASNS